MREFETNWTPDEFKAYVLIFCAHADCVETKEESDMIRSHVSNSGFKKIHEEFDHDNDYKSIQKIRHTIQRFQYSESQMDHLVAEIKELFLADGKLDIMESNLLLGLKRIIKD